MKGLISMQYQCISRRQADAHHMNLLHQTGENDAPRYMSISPGRCMPGVNMLHLPLDCQCPEGIEAVDCRTLVTAYPLWVVVLNKIVVSLIALFAQGVNRALGVKPLQDLARVACFMVYDSLAFASGHPL